jgi:hypothetical protein
MESADPRVWSPKTSAGEDLKRLILALEARHEI